MKSNDCTVVVTSCDAYRDVERPFLTLFRKYWPDCPFELVLVTETAATGGFDRTIATGTGKTWCQMLVEALDEIDTPYVLLLMNDYLLDAQVDTANILRRLGQARAFDAANLRLNPNPKGRTAWRDTDLLEFPKNVAYCVSCQTGFWRRDYLASLARRNKSAWEFERYGSFMVGDVAQPLLVTPTREFPFVDTVHKGHWVPDGVALLRRNNIDYDFSVRAPQPFGVRVREGLKSLVFAIFPWTLIVRVQNVFNAGMKERPRQTA